jgi:hypothetical protein
MNFFKRGLPLIFALGVFGLPAWGADTLTKTVDLTVRLEASGSATFSRVEKVPPSDLGSLFSAHADVLAKDARVRTGYLKEVTRVYQPIFGPALTFKVDGQDTASGLTRKMSAKAAGLQKQSPKDKSVRQFKVRQFANPKQLAPYYESVMDPMIFESAFLGSLKSDADIVSTDTTRIELPAGASLVNEKALNGKSWRVDFGGGSLMEASLQVDAKGPAVILTEKIRVAKGAPQNLLAKDNTALFDTLREYAAFIVEYKTKSAPAPAPEPEVEEAPSAALDFSGSWSHTISETFSHDFTYQQVVTFKPSVTVSFTLGAELKWEWRWYWSGWHLHCALDYFQTKLTLAPAVGAGLDITAGAAITKDWEKDVVTKSKSVSFTVACVPVLIVLEANLKLKAACGIQGAITVGVGGKVTLNTTLTCKYQNGWQQIAPTVTVTPQFTGSAHASVGITSTAKAEAPFTVSAYLYYVAGPFARITPYIETTSQYMAQTGGQTGIHFNIHGGFTVSGGAKVAGWLKSLLGNLGEFSRDFYTKDVTIYDGWANEPNPPRI